MNFDIIIVGGGPAGCFTASLLQEKFKVLVLEEKKKAGGKACSGLVSKDIRKFIPVDGLVENEINDCVLYSPSGKKHNLGIKQGTFALDRDKLDTFLAGRVENISFGNKVEKIQVEKEKVKIKTNKEQFEAQLVIGADGHNSIVRRAFDVKPMQSVLGLMTMVVEKDDSGFFEVWFDSGKVKDGFLWRIPRGNRVEYGVLGTGVKFEMMEDFFKLKGKNCKCERRASPIPTGFHKTYFDRTLLIGDAAAQTKPWSFGGIYYGMVGGKIAAEVIKKAFDKHDFSEKVLKEYEIKWRKELGDSISMGMMFREFYKGLDNRKIEEGFEVAKKMGLKEIDMDHPLVRLFG